MIAMPYYDDAYGSEKAEFDWGQLEGLFETIKRELTDWIIESEDDVFSEKYEKLSYTKKDRLLSYSVIRYRDSDDRDMLLGFHEMGLSRIPIVKTLIDKGELTPNLLYHWGILCGCHAYLLNGSLAQSTDLMAEANRRKASAAQGVEPQAKWYAHWRKFWIEQGGDSAIAANRRFIGQIFDVLEDRRELPKGFDKEWFSRCLAKTKDGVLKAELSPTLRRLPQDTARYERLKASHRKHVPVVPFPFGFREKKNATSKT